jgi:hypothetical protein
VVAISSIRLHGNQIPPTPRQRSSGEDSTTPGQTASACKHRPVRPSPLPRLFPVSHPPEMLLGRRDSLVYCGQVGYAS